MIGTDGRPELFRAVANQSSTENSSENSGALKEIQANAKPRSCAQRKASSRSCPDAENASGIRRPKSVPQLDSCRRRLLPPRCDSSAWPLLCGPSLRAGAPARYIPLVKGCRAWLLLVLSRQGSIAAIHPPQRLCRRRTRQWVPSN